MKKPFEQGSGSGLCAVYAIINALSLMFPRHVSSEVEEELLAALTDAYPGDVRDLIKEGCERPEMESMLHGISRWTAERKWPDWTWRALHPVQGESTAEFWDAVRAELEAPRTAAVVGFGEDTEKPSRYEPHWTCVTRVMDHFIFLRDSADYKRIPRHDTGVRPAPRWAIEDAFILCREAR